MGIIEAIRRGLRFLEMALYTFLTADNRPRTARLETNRNWLAALAVKFVKIIETMSVVLITNP